MKYPAARHFSNHHSHSVSPWRFQDIQQITFQRWGDVNRKLSQRELKWPRKFATFRFKRGLWREFCTLKEMKTDYFCLLLYYFFQLMLVLYCIWIDCVLFFLGWFIFGYIFWFFFSSWTLVCFGAHVIHLGQQRLRVANEMSHQLLKWRFPLYSCHCHRFLCLKNNRKLASISLLEMIKKKRLLHSVQRPEFNLFLLARSHVSMCPISRGERWEIEVTKQDATASMLTVSFIRFTHWERCKSIGLWQNYSKVNCRFNREVVQSNAELVLLRANVFFSSDDVAGCLFVPGVSRLHLSRIVKSLSLKDVA